MNKRLTIICGIKKFSPEFLNVVKKNKKKLKK